MNLTRAQANSLTSTLATVQSGPSSAGSADSTSLSGVSKGDFLKLLIAQIRNQDPMKPMDDSQFIAQMAQLNTVEELTAIDNRLSQFVDSQATFQASSLLGKSVVAERNGSEAIAGLVEEVRVEQGKPILIVAGKEVQLPEITKIAPATESA